MRLIETTLTSHAVQMKYADDSDPAKASRWFTLHVPIADLKHPGNDVELEAEKLDLQMVAEVRQAALRYARDLIVEEIKRLAALRGHR